MQIRVGDLVVVVKAPNYSKTLGHFGTVLGKHPDFPAYWQVDLPHCPPPIPSVPWCGPSACFRPIRDQPGRDETLTWRALPKVKELVR